MDPRFTSKLKLSGILLETFFRQGDGAIKVSPTAEFIDSENRLLGGRGNLDGRRRRYGR